MTNATVNRGLHIPSCALYRVYLKPSSPSITFPPAAALRFARTNFSSSIAEMMIISALAIIVVYMPGLYVGLSCSLNTVLPIIPPIPPAPTSVALASALFHWPRILFACQVSTQGTFALQEVVARKAPT